MKILRVLLIENTQPHASGLHRKLTQLESIRFVVTHSFVKNAESVFKDSSDRLDVILFSERVPSTFIIHLTKFIREYNLVIPIFILTKQSEARVTRKYRTVGVDDTVNIAEIDTPLFAWTFMSTVEHAGLKKKAREYDILNHRLKKINESLSTLIHDINNPLSVIRLAMYHLDNPKISLEKKEIFLKLLVNNVERLETQMKDLRTIRHQLHGRELHTAEILSLTLPSQVSAQK